MSKKEHLLFSYIVIGLSTLLLSHISPTKNGELTGTWYAITDGRLNSVVFGPDSLFEFTLEGYNLQKENLAKLNITTTMYYKVDSTTTPKRIYLTFEMHHADAEPPVKKLEMHGIYEFVSESELKLDFRKSNKPALQEFSEQAITYTSDFKSLAKDFPKKSDSGSYIFSYEKDGVLVHDTIRSDNPRYHGIDSIYQISLEPKDER